MSLKLFRCSNPRCRDTVPGRRPEPFTFAATDPVCPKCQTDQRGRFGRLVQRLVCIHFDPPAHIPGFGLGTRACNPDVGIQVAGGPDGTDDNWMPNPFHAGTAEPDAVNCPACRATEAWRKAFADAHSENSDAFAAALARLQPFMTPA